MKQAKTFLLACHYRTCILPNISYLMWHHVRQVRIRKSALLDYGVVTVCPLAK